TKHWKEVPRADETTIKQEFIQQMMDLGAAYDRRTSEQERVLIENEASELYEKHWKEVSNEKSN
ncbi:hypothetical protein ABK046_49210, partial [Streptomyces caeruleatus]